MRLLGGIPAPAVEGVVEQHACLELLEVVAEHARKAERGREEAGRLRREIEPRGVGGAHDRRQTVERRAGEAERLDHRVEGAALALMAPEHAVNVERCGIEALGHRLYLGRGHEQEDGIGVDEAPDEPGTGDAIDLGPRARHPDRASGRVASRQFTGIDEQAARGAPGFEPAFKRFGLDAFVEKPGSGALAELLPFLANDHDVAVGELPRPIGGV